MEIFLQGTPGLEGALADEARALGLADLRVVAGGVITSGDMAVAMRANLWLRGAGRVLIRVAEFRAPHLAQLDRRARGVDWAAILRPDRPWRVEATCRSSKIYHQRAAAQRIEGAITDALGVGPTAEAAIVVKLRIEDDLAQLSLDTSGESLHKRGTKPFVGKAPMKETLAAAFLRLCDWRVDEPLVDPMCGSGTFLIEAAGLAAGRAAGADRHFAFEDFAGFDAAQWAAMRAHDTIPPPPSPRIFGFDRDQGAIAGAGRNLAQAGLGDWVALACQPISALVPPCADHGLVVVNPPYGARIGNRKQLFGLYGAFGTVMAAQFKGWRVGLVTSDDGLARATGLSWASTSAPISFGGLTVKLWQTRL